MTRIKLIKLAHFLFFFTIGAIAAVSVIVALFLTFFYLRFEGKVYPGVKVAGVNYQGYTPSQLQTLLDKKYQLSQAYTFTYNDLVFNETDQTLGLSLASQRTSQRAFAIGRDPNPYYSVLQIISAYSSNIDLPLDIDWDPGAKMVFLEKLTEQTNYPPIEAQFRFDPQLGADQRGRVVAFVQSKEGVALDQNALETQILTLTRNNMGNPMSSDITIVLTTVPVLPAITSQSVNNLQIVEKLASGESYFFDSIPGRIYNIELGMQKVSGSLIAPGETFSFNQAIGTVSAVFGFQKAYAIVKGKTVLDDGGGVCQVSTTLYRAVLNAGLPVVERVAHSYRVGFYEQGGFMPGLDATVYPPSPDFKFRNDTGNWLLLQGFFDKTNSKLTFEIFGKSDGREAVVSKPVILSTSPTPEPIYEDDPTLPVGQEKQVDTAHFGAKVYFTRKVTRNGEILIDEKVTTNYIPWPARYLRGTKT